MVATRKQRQKKKATNLALFGVVLEVDVDQLPDVERGADHVLDHVRKEARHVASLGEHCDQPSHACARMGVEKQAGRVYRKSTQRQVPSTQEPGGRGEEGGGTATD